MIFGHAFIKRAIYIIFLGGIIGVGMVLWLLFESKAVAYQTTAAPVTASTSKPFPVSVDVLAKNINENLDLNAFYDGTVAERDLGESLLARLTAWLAPYEWYQQLASPVGRIFVIWPGQRKEEVAAHIAGILRWDATETAEFVKLLTTMEPAFSEGKFFPGRYLTHREATPQDIATLINERFVLEISSRYPDKLTSLSLEDALTIASLLEREASDFENMREVSGVIWNRYFIDMPLQLDATLQYVRASEQAGTNYWPAVRPADKLLDSPYNTYEHAGLPPGPIANVTAAAVLATLNPYPTECLYYFHDENAGYHCSVTYEEHVAKLRARYGQGR